MNSGTFALLLLLLTSMLVSQNLASAAEATLAERNAWHGDTRAVLPKMTTPPVIDGVIHPDEWSGAAEFNAQVSQGWGTGARNFYPRQVIWYLGWDAGNIYLASRTPLFENERPRRQARSSVGSDLMMDDTLEMWIDPHGRNGGKELPSYYQTMVNALGVTYFARLFPSVGAKTDSWNPNWTIATHVDDKVMDIEIKMPAAGFGLSSPQKAGDVWGMMLARNFMFADWNQSPLAYEFPNFGFAVNSYYPLMTLSDNLPYVKFHSPVALYNGQAFVNADLLNPTTVSQEAKTTFKIISSDGKTTLYGKDDTLSLPAGQQVNYSVNEQIPDLDVTKPAAYRYEFTVTSGTGQEIFHTHFMYNPTENRELLTRKYPTPPDLTASASFNPVRFMLQTGVDVIDFPRKDEVTAAKVVVTDIGGKVLAESSTPKKFQYMYKDLVKLPELTPGKYSWKAVVLLKDGSEVPAGEGAFEKKNEAQEFPWWNTKLGDVQKVLWPYTPLKAEKNGQLLKAWGKEFMLDGLALPTQILSNGNADKWPQGRAGNAEVLSGQISLEAVIGGKTTRVKATGTPKLIDSRNYRINLTGAAETGKLRITSNTQLEQDGAYFIELTLLPKTAGQTVTVDRLDLSIPLRADMATFVAAHGAPGYSTYFLNALPTNALEGAKPNGRYSVWNPSLCGTPQMTVGDFVPQIWLGNEHRGLLWYADNDQGWTPTDGKHAQQIDRDGKQTILVLHLISVPTEIKEPRTLKFVLQPTPIRPMQSGWRMLNSSFSQSFMDASSYGRDSANYSASINLNGDAAYAKSLQYSKNFPAFRAPRPSTMLYFAPHTESSAIMTTDWTARNYFGGEWENGTYTSTLNDHTLWYVNKWIEQGGLQGLYHDQFFPHHITSVSSGLAYVLPDGRVQPGYALTTRRDYVMREHALWMEKGIFPPRTLTHTTNGGPIGCYGWVESCVDGEDKQININTPLDFADTWPSERIRAGSLSYNWGVTFSWMRLFDTKGMTTQQIDAQTRVYAGHCLMHDITNAYQWSYDWGYNPKSPLLSWGMDDDRVFFWPFWSNGDVLTGNTTDVKISAWTLPDRLLLCVFNYSKEQQADCTVSTDLKKMGGNTSHRCESLQCGNQCRYTITEQSRENYRTNNDWQT